MTYKFTAAEREQWQTDLGATRRSYITERYASDGIIPKEIYKLYKEIPKDKIDRQISDTCVLCKTEKPIIAVEKKPLFEIKQLVVDKENEEGEQKEIVYENMPGQLNLELKQMENLSMSPVCYWRPYQLTIIEDTLRRIPELYIRVKPNTVYENFKVLRGYFDSQMIDLICLIDTFVCRKITPVAVEKEGEEEDEKKWTQQISYVRRVLAPNELAMLIEKIGDALEARNPQYKKHCRIVTISQKMWCSLNNIKNNLPSRPRGKIRFGLMFLGDSRDGLIIEYDERVATSAPLARLGIMEIKQPRDVINRIDFGKTGRTTRCMYGLKDFKTPIIKRIKFYRPNKSVSWTKPRPAHMTYSKDAMIHIAKYLRTDLDVERFEELYPDILFRKVAARTDNPDFVQRKVVVTNLLKKLDNLSK